MKQSTITTLFFVFTITSVLSSCGDEHPLFEVQPAETQISHERRNISWLPIEGSETYRILRSIETMVPEMIAETTQTHYVILSDRGYDYRIQGCVKTSCFELGYVHVDASNPPNSMLELTRITWEDLDHALYYEIADADFIQMATTTNTQYALDNVQNTYHIRGCIDAKQCSPYHTPTNTVTVENIVIFNEILSWDALTDASYYEVQQQSGDIFVAYQTLEADDLQLTLSDASVNYRIRGCQNSNNCSHYGYSLPLASPTLNAASQSEIQINLSWNAVANATHYRLNRRAATQTSFTEIFSANSTRFNDANLDANTTYIYQVAACFTSDASTCSAVSTEQSATTFSPNNAGDLRIIPLLNNEAVGRLEVYYENQWGTVCSRRFGDTDAFVACRQLGYSGGIEVDSDQTANGSGSIWLTNLRCSGLESQLSDCDRNDWGDTESCGHDDDVGVACSN